ncbi:hypothetical protein [Zooshikella ganghwensis]|uniref:hypothetical protein n=1 Tax=Zooshikella ganghwensis TaxID=202772 RepID=UPI0003F4B042|nr:hypothetical protein [Zooshikella ganghwensis]
MKLWFLVIIHSINTLLKCQSLQHDLVCHQLTKNQETKKQLVYIIWVITTFFMLICTQLLPVVIIIMLSTTFLGFMILDETE